MVDRSGCCDTWPKPCQYHEGWIDGADAAEQESAAMRAERDQLRVHIGAAMRNLGVSGPGYPASVATAWTILDDALHYDPIDRQEATHE